MKNIQLLFFLVVFSTTLKSQSLSPSVISSSGGFGSSGGYSLSYTMGEMTLVNTFNAGNSTLTQGFQQSENINVSMIDAENQYQIVVFPNPNNGTFEISCNTFCDASLAVQIYDNLGRLVSFTEWNNRNVSNQHSFDLSYLEDGIYWLDVKFKNGRQSSLGITQKIIIIH